MDTVRDTSTGRSRAIALVRLTRPDHLLLVAAVFLSGVGMTVAGGARMDTWRVVVGEVVVLVVATSIHVANEFADRDTDALTTRTPFSGGSGATADLPADLVATAMAASMVLAVGAVVVVSLAGWASASLVVLVVVAAVLGWQYSLPPLALSRRGWGEVDNAVLGGAMLPLAGAATLQPPTVAMVLAVVPATLAVFANLLATQWPDRWADAAVGKFTLATRWTPTTLRLVHGAVLGVALVLPWLLPRTVVPVPVALGASAAAPLAAWAIATFTRDDDPLPTVATMVVLLVGSGIGWWVVAAGLPAG